MVSIERIQKALKVHGLDGWLLYDFQNRNMPAHRILELSEAVHLTRRWFYLIPAEGLPKKIMHRIEPNALAHLPGDSAFYSTWRELNDGVRSCLKGLSVVAMEYSPRNAIPHVSIVDAGTIELVRSCNTEVQSSADLIQEFEAVWSEEQLATHKYAANCLHEIVNGAFRKAGTAIRDGRPMTESGLQDWIMKSFDERGLQTMAPPIVAVNENSGNPHYALERTVSTPVKEGAFVLIDLWAKQKIPGSVYADITWTAFMGKKVPKKYESVFQIVREARDQAFSFVNESIRQGKEIRGFQVDAVARKVIEGHGYGEFFTHRTGHNIGTEVHGPGTNIDGFETDDQRRILPKTCFSIEPGIYLKDFGIRSEIDVYVDEKGAHVFGQPIQTTVVSALT